MASLSMFRDGHGGSYVTKNAATNPLGVVAQLLNATAEDLRGPLVTARSAAQSIASSKELSASSEIASELQRVMQSCDDMQQLINEMLLLDTAPSAGKLARRCWFPIRSIIDPTENMLSSRLRAQKVSLNWIGFEETLPLVYADYGQIIRLISTMVQFRLPQVAEGQTIQLRTELTGSRDLMRMTVADHGEQMSSTDIEQLCDPSLWTKGSQGFGMTICRQIAAAHFGQIDLKATEETSLSIELPAQDISAVLSMFWEWRASLSIESTEQSTDSDLVRPTRRNSAPRQSLALPNSNVAPARPHAVTTVSACTTDDLDSQSVGAIDEFLQSQSKPCELICQVAPNQWMCLLDISIGETHDRLTQIGQMQSEHSDPAVRETALDWFGPVSHAFTSKEDYDELLESFGGNSPLNADTTAPQDSDVLEASADETGVPYQRLDDEVRWLVERFSNRQDQLNQQAESLKRYRRDRPDSNR